jgi:hypothetical protein
MSEDADKKRIEELEGTIKTLLTRLDGYERQLNQLNPDPRRVEPARLQHHIDAATRHLFDSVAKMPQEVVQKMRAAIPDDVMQDIANDARRDRR